VRPPGLPPSRAHVPSRWPPFAPRTTPFLVTTESAARNTLTVLSYGRMAVTFDIPAPLEEQLRRSLGNLDQEAKEAALVGLYRQNKLTHHELSQALGTHRIETDAVLRKHNVTEDLPSADEFRDELDTIRNLASKP
jgi:hypothetical protein